MEHKVHVHGVHEECIAGLYGLSVCLDSPSKMATDLCPSGITLCGNCYTSQEDAGSLACTALN